MPSPTTAAQPESRPKNVRAPTALGVSMLLLLLSAIHNPAQSDGLMDPNGPQQFFRNHRGSASAGGPWTYSQTPYLAYVASIAAGDDFDMCGVLNLGSGPSTASADDRPARRRGAAKRAAAAITAATAGNSVEIDADDSDASSSASTTALSTADGADATSNEQDLSSTASMSSGRSTPQSIRVPSDSNNVSSVPAPTAAARAVSIDELPAELLGDALTFMNARDLGACRHATRAMDDVAEACCVVTKPYCGAPGASFIFVDPDAPCPTVEGWKCANNSWYCVSCGQFNKFISDECRRCKAPNGPVRKVFFGQLRKEKTVEVLRFLISYLLPGVRVLHIESHTNAASGNGKGSAWVYVASDDDAAQLLTLNKTLFYDFDEVTQREGVWLAGEETGDHLAGMAARIAYLPQRPTVMPRQLVVAEMPRGSRPLCPSSEVSWVPAATALSPAKTEFNTAAPSSGPRNRRRPAAAPYMHTAAAAANDAYFNYHHRAANTVTFANTARFATATATSTVVPPPPLEHNHVTATHYNATVQPCESWCRCATCAAFGVASADDSVSSIRSSSSVSSSATLQQQYTTHQPYDYSAYNASFASSWYTPGCPCAECAAYAQGYYQSY